MFSFFNKFSKELNKELADIDKDTKEYFDDEPKYDKSDDEQDVNKTITISQEKNSDLKKNINELYLKHSKEKFNLNDIIHSINNDLSLMLEVNNIQEKNEIRRLIEHYLLELIIKKKGEPQSNTIEVKNTENKFEKFSIKENNDKNNTRKIKTTVLPSLRNEYFHQIPEEENKDDKLQKLSYDLADSVYLKEDNDISWQEFIKKNIDETQKSLNYDKLSKSKEKEEVDQILKFIQKRKEKNTFNEKINMNTENTEPIKLIVGNALVEDTMFNPFYITKLNTSINDEIELFRDKYEEMSRFMDSSFYIKTFEKEPELNFLKLKYTSKLAYEYKMFKYKCINDVIQFLKDDPTTKFEYNEKTESVDYKGDSNLTKEDVDKLIERFQTKQNHFWNEDTNKYIHESDVKFTRDFYKMFEPKTTIK